MPNTSRFLSSLKSGPTPEPKIENREFLHSFVKYGVWLRLIAAHDQYETIQANDSTKLQELAACAEFYQLAGIILEDVAANIVAWAAIAATPSLLLAAFWQSGQRSPEHATRKPAILNQRPRNHWLRMAAKVARAQTAIDKQLPPLDFAQHGRRSPLLKTDLSDA